MQRNTIQKLIDIFIITLFARLQIIQLATCWILIMLSIMIVDRQTLVSVANAAPTQQPSRSWGMGIPYTLIYQQREPVQTKAKTSKTTRTTKTNEEPTVATASSITHLFFSEHWGPSG